MRFTYTVDRALVEKTCSPAEPRGWTPRLKANGGKAMSSYNNMILVEVETPANVEAGVDMVVKVVVVMNLVWVRGPNQTDWPSKLFFDLMIPISVFFDLYHDRVNGFGKK